MPDYVYSVLIAADTDGAAAVGRVEWCQQAFLTYNNSAWVVHGVDGEAAIYNDTDVDVVAAQIRNTPFANDLSEAFMAFVTSLCEKLPISGWAFALEICPDTLKDCGPGETKGAKGARGTSAFVGTKVVADVLRTSMVSYCFPSRKFLRMSGTELCFSICSKELHLQMPWTHFFKGD